MKLCHKSGLGTCIDHHHLYLEHPITSSVSCIKRLSYMLGLRDLKKKKKRTVCIRRYGNGIKVCFINFTMLKWARNSKMKYTVNLKPLSYNNSKGVNYFRVRDGDCHILQRIILPIHTE